MNKLFTFLFSFVLGMMLFLPIFSYIKWEKERYAYAPTDMFYPKHPIVECVRDVECSALSEAGYYEARSEPDIGVLAVFSVITNRVTSPRWENSIQDVIEAPRQFSFTHDGSRERGNMNISQWARMYYLAYKYLNGELTVPEEFSKLTHYHNLQVSPKWAKHYEVVTVLGNHKFYSCKRRC